MAGDVTSGAGAGADDGAAPPGYRALVAGCAVAPAPPASGLELTGADRGRFLHGQVTCEVKDLTPGRGVYGFFVSAKGRVLADAVISAGEDLLRVELPPETAAETAERLRRYLVADRVEIEALDEMKGWWVAGPDAAAALGPLLDGDEPPDGWDHLDRSGPAGAWTIRGERRLGVPAWRLAGDRAALGPAIAALREAGAVEAGADALEAVRVERGLPRAGVDFDERHFPQETGLEDWAVSYTKGCYIGQEVVARIHYRGKVNHRLCGLRGGVGAVVPSTGPLRDAEGAEGENLTSVVHSPALDRAVGLAILHRRRAEAGTKLIAPGGVEMEVVALPFVESA